jgi:hypothetical protein
MRWLKFTVPVLIALAVVVAVNVSTPKPAEAFIHEMIAALCNGGDPVEPPGQVPGGPSKGNSVTRALIATGFITGDEFVAGDPDALPDPINDAIKILFDVDVPSSKFTSAGFDLRIMDGAGPGLDLILSPLPVPDPAFPAHANCFNGLVP